MRDFSLWNKVSGGRACDIRTLAAKSYPINTHVHTRPLLLAAEGWITRLDRHTSVSKPISSARGIIYDSWWRWNARLHYNVNGPIGILSDGHQILRSETKTYAWTKLLRRIEETSGTTNNHLTVRLLYPSIFDDLRIYILYWNPLLTWRPTFRWGIHC